MNFKGLGRSIAVGFVFLLTVQAGFSQIYVKPNLDVVISDTTKFTSFDQGRLSVSAYNKQFGLTLKQIVTDTVIGNQYLYGLNNIQNTETLPWSGVTNASPYVRVGFQTQMTTRFGQFINSLYNYIIEKPNSSAPGYSQTTGILNKMDTISNQLNGVYNSVRASGSGDVKLMRNYMDQRAQSNVNGVVQGLYNEIEMSGNKNNYGVYNLMKSNYGYAPSAVYNYEVAGVKNWLIKGDTTTIALLNGYSQKTIGVLNDIAAFGGYLSSTYGVYNIMRATQTSASDIYGVRVDMKGDATFDTTNTATYVPRKMYGIYSVVDNNLTTKAYAALFTGNVSINGTMYMASDIALKENIADLTGAVQIVKSINPKSYTLKSEKSTVNLKTHLGFIAQEIEAIAPNLVASFIQPGKINIKQNVVPVTKVDVEKDKFGNPFVKSTIVNEIQETKTEDPGISYKAVNYTEIIPILLQAIKEQQVVIEQLQKDVEILKKK